MNFIVQQGEETKKFDVDIDFLRSQYSVIDSLYNISIDNKSNEIILDISHIKNMNLDLFGQFLDICDKVEKLIGPKRQELQTTTYKQYKVLKIEIDRRRKMIADKHLSSDQKNLKDCEFNAALEEVAVKHYYSKKFVNMPKSKENIYHDNLKKYIHNNHHNSPLFVEYAKKGVSLVYIINLANFLGGGEATYHMGAYMLYIQATDSKNFNLVYEGGKKYDPNEVFYEDKEKNKSYHEKLVRNQKLLEMSKKFGWEKHIDLAKVLNLKS